MIRPVVDLAWLTIREAARRRLFIVLLLITAASVALSAWGFSQFRDAILAEGPPLEAGGLSGELALTFIYAQLLVLVTFMFSFILVLSAVFIASPVIAGEIESGRSRQSARCICRNRADTRGSGVCRGPTSPQRDSRFDRRRDGRGSGRCVSPLLATGGRNAAVPSWSAGDRRGP